MQLKSQNLPGKSRQWLTFYTETCRSACDCCQSMFDLDELSGRREGGEGEATASFSTAVIVKESRCGLRRHFG